MADDVCIITVLMSYVCRVDAMVRRSLYPNM